MPAPAAATAPMLPCPHRRSEARRLEQPHATDETQTSGTRARPGSRQTEEAGGRGLQAQAGDALLRGAQEPRPLRPRLGLNKGPLTTRYLVRRLLAAAIVNLESQPRRASPTARAILASRDSRPQVE